MDKERIEKAKNEPYKSQLKTLISAMMRYPGFKYKSTHEDGDAMTFVYGD